MQQGVLRKIAGLAQWMLRQKLSAADRKDFVGEETMRGDILPIAETEADIEIEGVWFELRPTGRSL